jgi:hypothetical protein
MLERIASNGVRTIIVETAIPEQEDHLMIGGLPATLIPGSPLLSSLKYFRAAFKSLPPSFTVQV